MIGKQQQSPEKSAADCVRRRSSLISDSSRKVERSVQDRPNGSDCASRRSLNRHCKLQITGIEKSCVKTIQKDAFRGFEERRCGLRLKLFESIEVEFIGVQFADLIEIFMVRKNGRRDPRQIAIRIRCYESSEERH